MLRGSHILGGGGASLPSTIRVTATIATEAMRKRRKAALAGSTTPASNRPAMKVPPHRSMVRVSDR